MKKALLITMVCMIAACGFAQTFTDIDSAQYYGKINIPKTHAAIDANFALLETGGTIQPLVISNANGVLTYSNATFNGTLTVTGATDLNGAVTSTNITMDTGSTLAAKALTCTSLSTGTGEATVDGKYAVVGPDATTGLMVDIGRATNGQTVAFTAAFATAPNVLMAPSATNFAWYAASITTSNFVATGYGASTNDWIAVGARP